jgi:hypothetical protein
MSNKTTAILTFLVSTVIPFIQEVVDFISMFRTGTYDKSGSDSLRSISLAMQDDLVNMQKREVKTEDSFRSVASTEEKPYSRFLGKTH